MTREEVATIFAEFIKRLDFTLLDLMVMQDCLIREVRARFLERRGDDWERNEI